MAKQIQQTFQLYHACKTYIVVNETVRDGKDTVEGQGIDFKVHIYSDGGGLGD